MHSNIVNDENEKERNDKPEMIKKNDVVYMYISRKAGAYKRVYVESASGD